MSEETKNVLSLSTTERQTVTIDGTEYPLRKLAEFSLRESHELAKVFKAQDSIMDLMGKDDSDQRIEEIQEAVTKAACRVLVGADEVIQKLGNGQQQQILKVFLQESGIPTASPSSTKSPGSNDSTADARETGKDAVN